MKKRLFLFLFFVLLLFGCREEEVRDRGFVGVSGGVVVDVEEVVVVPPVGLVRCGKNDGCVEFDEVQVVSGVSMLPTIQDGDYVFIRYVDFGVLEVGDVIWFYEGETGRYLVHRVESVYDGSLVTKGDNNKVFDKWIVTEDELRGLVVGIVEGF